VDAGQNAADVDARSMCTLKSCPKFNVEKYLLQLRHTLPCVSPVPVRALKSLHKARDYTGMVRLVRRAMNVEIKLRVGLVNSGTAAWIKMPPQMPFFGSEGFRELMITIYFRRSFLEESTYGQVAIAIAHELAHVVLESIRHPLCKCEKAVDLTAMILGFSHLYESHARTERRRGNEIKLSDLGYLSAPELKTAYRLLTPTRLRLRTATFRLLLATVQRFWRLMVLVGVLATWAAGAKIYDTWQLHEELLAEKAKYQIPRSVDPDTILVGVRVGITSLTATYNSTIPKDRGNVPASEAATQRNVCATKAARVKKGASYNFEFFDPTGALLAQFAVTSCP
jgi:hypothetical protein